MPWYRVDDSLWGSPVWAQLPNSAKALWVTAGSWSCDQLTNGEIPAHMLGMLGGRPSDARALVETGGELALWAPIPGGWFDRSFDGCQLTRDQVLAERAAAAERQKRARDKATANRGKPNSNGVSHGVTTGVSHGDSHASSHGPPVLKSSSVVSSGDTGQVSNAGEPEHDDPPEPATIEPERPGPKISLGLRDVVRIYTSKVQPSNFNKIANVITSAMFHYELDIIAKAVKEMADDRRIFTPDALRIEIEQLGLPDKSGVVHIQGGFVKDWETGIIRNRDGIIIGRDWPCSNVPKFRDA